VQHEDPVWVVAHDNYRLLSVNINVRIGDEEFAARLRWHLEPFFHQKLEHESGIIDVSPLEGDQHDDPWWVYEAGDDRLEAPRKELLNHAIWHLHAQASRRTADYLLLHAGAVARDGVGVLLPAARDTGKSTLVAALLRTGFRYLSDELGAIDPITRQAYPFAKRITLDNEALRFFPGLADRMDDRVGIGQGLYQRHARPEDLESSVSGPVVIGALVFPTMNREGTPSLTEIPRAEAVEEMARNCLNLYRYGARGVRLFAAIATGARCFRLEGGNPLERASLLAEALG
jgi:hypothetical protein